MGEVGLPQRDAAVDEEHLRGDVRRHRRPEDHCGITHLFCASLSTQSLGTGNTTFPINSVYADGYLSGDFDISTLDGSEISVLNVRIVLEKQ